jgi:quercetin dioxygenase-like cupin family protein
MPRRILTGMDVTRERKAAWRGPGENFTGTVWVDEVASNDAPSRVRAAIVHFEPGARTSWHRHPLGQVIHVLDGEGRAQADGGLVEVIRAGDTVHFLPGERHWHGAAPARFMAHLAIQEADDQGVQATWEEHVSDEEYRGRA